MFHSSPSIPPRLCLLIKNVDSYIDVEDFCDNMLNERQILINHILYDIVEYLSSTHVLNCSKCMALGHFIIKQCTQVTETCHTYSELYDDIKYHKCSKNEK